jgi:hypothetical protein
VLQDIGLAIHPPLLYLRYVGFSVAFAIAVAALIEGCLRHGPERRRPGCNNRRIPDGRLGVEIKNPVMTPAPAVGEVTGSAIHSSTRQPLSPGFMPHLQ